MAKIRGIKPEFWTDDDVCEASLPARLLFIGMWNWSCDNGHLQDKPKQIKRRILPADEVNGAELLRELTDLGLIERGDGWITIPNLTHHQRPDRRYFLTCDHPGCTKPDPGNSQRKPRRAHTVAPPGTHRAHALPLVDGDGDGDGDGEGKKRLDQPQAADRDFDRFWESYPRRIGKGAARRSWKTATTKADADTIIVAASAFTARVGAKDPKYIPHPSTWLNQERWSDDPDPDFTPKSRQQQDLDSMFERQMARAAERDQQDGQWKAIGA